MITPRKLAVVATGVCGLLAAPALATTANDICAPSANPCLVQGTVLVSDGSLLDFGSRALVLQRPGSRLDIGSGSVTIRAGSLTMNPGSSILGAPACGSTPPFPTGGLLVAEITGDIALLRDGNSRARIDVSNCANPGTIRLIGGATISIEGILTAQGTQADGGFGTIDIVTPGDVTIPGSITAAGGGFSGGGEIFISSTQGEINVSGSLDSSGGDGGGVSLSAAGRILTSEGGILSRIDARATAGGGSGGIIDLLAGTDMTIGSALHSQGEASLDLGGDGGEVLIGSGGTLAINAPINLFGTVPDGIGGDADISSALDVVQLGAIDASGKRSFGAGGIVELLAQRNLTVGPINARGDCDDCAGGDIDAEGWCSVLVPSGVIVDAGGPAGTVIVEGGGSTTVQGTVTAGSSIDFIYHPSGSPPNLSGSTISPTPVIVSDVNVVRCGGPGACDRDGVPEEGEECDDGNDNPCDACSNACKIVQCGNDRLDAPCEECDDGNTNNCDGCRGDCSRADAVCGDTTLECGEACDPGSAISCNPEDTCSAQCTTEGCGNGVQECDEECDLGAQNGQPGALCSATCTDVAATNCGNDQFEPELGEQCDDGNNTDCDGCNALCEEERCGNSNPECLEECDDGNESSCDGCTPECVEEACGNGVQDCGEECDQGELNGQPGSTCLPLVCRVGQVCTTESSGACIPCADALECDPLGLCGGSACDLGICTPTTLACDDTNPCTTDGCDALEGCTHTLLDAADVPECDDGDSCTDASCTIVSGCQQTQKTEFPSVDCRLGDLQTLLADDGLDAQARSSLGKLLAAAQAKMDTAEQGQLAGKAKKVKVGLKAARKKLVRFGKKVVKLEPAHISDPDVATALSEQAFDATSRVDALRQRLGL